MPKNLLFNSIAKQRTVLFTLPLLIFAGCAQIPKHPHKPVSYSQPPATAGVLTETRDAVMKDAEKDESAFMLIQNNADALRWRLALIDQATKSIDLQVFIWSYDESGVLILDRLIAAAQRGVQIRLLADDIQKDWSDDTTALVARIPNIQLRRFNPGRVRKGVIRRMYQMSTQFRTLNRRMHNKQMVVDGQWAIIGGRNIGNPYFGLSKKYNNRDLDLLTTGAVIKEMAQNFDEYWNADTAYPGEAMSDRLSERKIKKISKQFIKDNEKNKELLTQASIPVDPLDWSVVLATLPQRMVTGTAQCLQDSPQVRGDRGIRLIDQLANIDFNVQHQSVLITPYMIPSQDQLNAIRKSIRDNNTRIRILVPSMESNNQTMAHSHYKKYRKKLLSAGAELYEFKGHPSADTRKESDAAPMESKFISLHTKAFVLDRNWVLLGSLNMDPRSIRINTEHMLVINCPALAEELLSDFEILTSPENAWAVTLNEKGKVRWTSDEGERKWQPARGFIQRGQDLFYRLLPIEKQL
jgi:putative cardiolipin synthase